MFDLMLPYFGKREKNIHEGLITVEALDFLSICFFHGHFTPSTGNEMTSSLLFRRIAQSSSFRKILRGQMEHTVSTMEKRSLSAKDKMVVSVNLRYLRLLRTVFDVGPSFAAKILGGENASVVNSLVDAVSRTLLEAGSRDMTGLLADETLVDHMRIAVGCLSALSSIWRYARARLSHDGTDVGRSALRKIVDSDSVLVRNLASFVFQFAEKLSNASNLDNEGVLLKRRRCVVRCLLSVASEC